MVNSRQRQWVTIVKRNQRHRGGFAQAIDTETDKTCGAVNILSKTLAISNEEDGDSATIPAPCP